MSPDLLDDGTTDNVDPPAPAIPVPPAASPEIRTLLGLAVAAIVIAALYAAQDVLIPITLAVILSFVLSPLVGLLERLRLWRAPAVIVSVLAALGGIVLIGTLIGSQASTLAADAPQYAATIERKLERAQQFATAHIAAVTSLFSGLDRTPPAATSPAPATSATQVPPIPVEIANPETSPFAIVRTILAPVLGPLETTVIVIIVAIFILLEKEDLRDRFIRLVGSADLNRTTAAMDDAGQRLSRYFISQLAVNTTFGVVIGLGLWAIGVPSPALWGVVSGILRFVPYLGSILAAVAPAALAAAMDPGWSMAVYVAALFVVVEPLTGYVVEPLLYGHSTGLSPISVIVAAVFWTWMWGPIGLILSTPLTLCLVVMGRHVKSLEFFDVLLGDRPALPAVERFYQRILADDPDEVLDQAETIVANQSLLDYYDGVVLQGLKLAAEDETRGSIGTERAAEMTRALLTVIDDLHAIAGARKTTVTPAPAAAAAAGPAVVACIAGRGPFDDVVSAMLAQLLGDAGIASIRVPYRQVSREEIAQFDVAGASVIALSYLELKGSPAHLRYLIARLRQRAPHARVLVGLWPAGESALTDATAQKLLGADRYVGSLRDAVEAVQQSVRGDRDRHGPSAAA